MNKKPILISALITALVSVPFGAYLGVKIFPDCGAQIVINTMVLEQSHELGTTALLLDGLNKGKTKEVIHILHTKIKTELESDTLYQEADLWDDTVKKVQLNRKKAKEILDRYESNQK